MGASRYHAAARGPLRLIWTILKYAILLTFPLTSIALIGGIINGTLISFWLPDRVKQNTIALFADLDSISQDWGVPSFTFREFQNTNNDFKLRRLNTNDWVSRLGFTHPEQYEMSLDPDRGSNMGIDTYGDIPSLMYDELSSCQRPPKEQWVYISDMAWPGFSRWDSAFQQAIEVGYATDPINATRLFFVECLRTGKFLCGIWNVRAPTLLHFSYDDDLVAPEDIKLGLTYPAGIKGLHKVTTRATEFPLKEACTGLPSTVFPSEKEQLLSIMRGDRLYEQFEPYDRDSLAFDRMIDYLDKVWNKKGTILNNLYKIEDWVDKKLFKTLQLQDIYSSIHIISAFITYTMFTIILKPWFLLTHYFWEFLGVSEFEPEHNPLDSLMKQMNPWRSGFVGELWSSFWRNITSNYEIENQRLYRESGTTQAPLPQWTEVVEAAERYRGV